MTSIGIIYINISYRMNPYSKIVRDRLFAIITKA